MDHKIQFAAPLGLVAWLARDGAKANLQARHDLLVYSAIREHADIAGLIAAVVAERFASLSPEQAAALALEVSEHDA